MGTAATRQGCWQRWLCDDSSSTTAMVAARRGRQQRFDEGDGGRRWNRAAAAGGGRRGGEGGATRWSVCFVFYLALSYEASKNLETFQETSSRLPGTPLPVVTGLVVDISKMY